MRRLLSLLSVAAVAACSGDSPVFTSGSLRVSEIKVSVNQHNALSLRVDFDAVAADSARVLYTAPGDSNGATPWVRLASGHNEIVVLGLLPATRYSLELDVNGPNATHVTPLFHGNSGELPVGLADAHLTYTGTPGPGYTLVSPIEPTGAITTSTFAMAFDSLGRLRWYREFPNWESVDVQMQRNGHFTIGLNYPSLESGIVQGPFVEFLPSGDSVASYVAPTGVKATDVHEILLSGTPATGQFAAFFAYDTARTENLTAIGGSATASILGHSIFRLRPGGAVDFSWDAWNSYGLADWTEAANNGFVGDFDHPNAISFDLDSNYLVSFRNMDAITKIDRQTGAIIWQLGGARSSFTFANDPLGGFSGQHFARRLANGHILCYDDGLRHAPPQSRAAEYALDSASGTATLVWQYIPSPSVFTAAVGSAERLANGNTVVGFGLAAQIDEVDKNSKLLARGMFNWTGAKAFYRALRLPSLYEYETP